MNADDIQTPTEEKELFGSVSETQKDSNYFWAIVAGTLLIFGIAICKGLAG